MGSSWFWMSGASVSYIYWKEQHIWQVTSPCGGVDADDSFYWRNVPCGDHLYFVCLKGKPTKSPNLERRFFFVLKISGGKLENVNCHVVRIVVGLNHKNLQDYQNVKKPKQNKLLS